MQCHFNCNGHVHSSNLVNLLSGPIVHFILLLIQNLIQFSGTPFKKISHSIQSFLLSQSKGRLVDEQKNKNKIGKGAKSQKEQKLLAITKLYLKINFGNNLMDLLFYGLNYTFHAKGSFSPKCILIVTLLVNNKKIQTCQKYEYTKSSR